MTKNGADVPIGVTGSRLRGRRGNWALRFPVGLIVVSLIALVVVPLVVQRETTSLAAHRDEIAQPARDLVNTIQRSLAREMGALRGFVISEDEAFLERYEEALEEERRATSELAPLVANLDPEVGAAFSELRRRASRWHGRVTEAEILTRQLVPEEFIDRIRSEEVRYEQTLAAAETLRERIVAEVEVNRQASRRMERTSLIVTAILALLAAGAAFGALWLGRRLRALAFEAERRREEVERVEEHRARLIRGITHDLKNPLGGARGHLQLIEAGIVDDPERVQRGVNRADRAIGTALEIIKDLLDLSKAEAGELSLSREPTDLAGVVREAVEDQQAAAERAGLDFQLDTADGLPALYTDPRRVREIVRNLVSNARKYTPKGGSITVCVRASDDRGADGNGQRGLRVDVVDTGRGIAPEEHENIFREFSRLETEGAAEGTGLGLAISRHTARLLGGDVTVASEVGRGSTFTLQLPLRASEGTPVDS